MNFDLFGITRTAFSTTAALGAAVVVGNVVTATLPPAAALPLRIATAIGGMAIGIVVSDNVQNHIEHEFDEVRDSLISAKAAMYQSPTNES